MRWEGTTARPWLRRAGGGRRERFLPLPLTIRSEGGRRNLGPPSRQGGAPAAPPDQTAGSCGGVGMSETLARGVQVKGRVRDRSREARPRAPTEPLGVGEATERRRTSARGRTGRGSSGTRLGGTRC